MSILFFNIIASISLASVAVIGAMWISQRDL